MNTFEDSKSFEVCKFRARSCSALFIAARRRATRFSWTYRIAIESGAPDVYAHAPYESTWPEGGSAECHLCQRG